MKKTFLIIALLLNSFAIFAQEIYEKPVVDERVELMNIVFRLAEISGYVNNNIPMYVDEADRYFEKYKNHPLIEYTKILQNTLQNVNGYGFSLGVGVRFAILLELKNGKIAFNKNIKTDIADSFNQDSIPKYLNLLNDFYKKTKFHNFFTKNEKIRQIAEKNFVKEITNKINFDWFKSFFRFLPEKKFRIIISLAGGFHNFGQTLVYKDDSQEFYAIIGCRSADENGFPMFKGGLGDMSNTLIHEICHSFCDAPILAYQDELLPQATVFFELNKMKLYEISYREPMAFLHEIFVRTCVFQYKKDNNIKYELANYLEEVEVFLWLPQLLEAFGKYRNDTTYKTLNDFMPEIVKLQNSLNPQKIYDEMPTITGTSIENGSENVDYNIDHITVYFDRQMLVGYEFPTPYVIIAQPSAVEFTKEKWNNEGTEWTFYVKLEPDTQYSIKIPYWNFIESQQRYFAKNDCILTFKTRKK